LIKIKFLPSILGFFVFMSVSQRTLAQTSSEDLFKKVFGKSSSEEKRALIDASLGDFFIGEVGVSLVGENIVKISSTDLKRLLADKIRETQLVKYSLPEGDVTPEVLPFKIMYHASELRVSILIPPEDLRPSDANVYDDLMPYYSRKAAEPAPFSMGLNYKLEQTFNKKTNQEDAFTAQTDAFLNIKKVAFENQMQYLSTRQENKWARQGTRAIFDRPNRMQRFEVGDVNFPIVGYQQSFQIGGISFYRDFSLNPYRVVNPTSSFEYRLDSRSLVKTYVNNILLKTEYMNAGSYSVKDIPLNNGVNRIVIEVVDEFGATKTFTFNESGSLDLLAKGISRYALSTGYYAYDKDGNKEYEYERGPITSGFYQHGFNKHWTLSAYAQGNKKYTMLGTNHIFASRFGNFSFDVAGNKNDYNTGAVTQATYQLNLFGAYWYDSHTLTTKLEYRTKYFNEVEVAASFKNRFDVTVTSSYGVPLFERFNVALGGTYQHPTFVENARLAYNGSLTTKIFESSSLTAYAGRSRDEFKTWSNQIYFFFNMTFGESSTFASAFYDKESQTKRLTVIRDTGVKYNDLKVSASVDDNAQSKNGSLDLQYNTVLADVGVREDVTKNDGQSEGTKTSIRFLSSFAFVHNGDDSAFSIGRPISNSFVIFKPNSDWKGQTFGVQTSSGVNDAGTGLFGEAVVSGLTPYQYRRLQLDPSRLEPGYILGQESFVVYPRKGSGHLFVIGKSGLLVLKGRILNKSQVPLALKVGFWTSLSGKSTPFFTDREGEFFIEGVEASVGTIQIDDENFRPTRLDLRREKQGIVEIGNIILPEGESVQ
jgi:outer membrane usher protein